MIRNRASLEYVKIALLYQASPDIFAIMERNDGQPFRLGWDVCLLLGIMERSRINLFGDFLCILIHGVSTEQSRQIYQAWYDLSLTTMHAALTMPNWKALLLMSERKWPLLTRRPSYWKSLLNVRHVGSRVGLMKGIRL
jgi:hypothetical protein